jgi:hypothetical protein
MLRQDTRLGDVVSTIALQDGALITGTTQDCTPYAERAKSMQAAGLHGSSDMRLAASVPAVLVERYCNQAGIDMAEFNSSQDHKKRLLNDPALAAFRIWPGRI